MFSGLKNLMLRWKFGLETELHLLQLPFSLCQLALINAVANCCCSNKRNAALLLERAFQDLSLRAKEGLRCGVRGSFLRPLRWVRAQAPPRSAEPLGRAGSVLGGAGSGSIPAGTGRRPGHRGGPGRSRRPQHPRGGFWQAGAARTAGAAVGARADGRRGRAGPGAAPPAGPGPRAPGGSDPASSARSLPAAPSLPWQPPARPSACPAPSRAVGGRLRSPGQVKQSR